MRIIQVWLTVLSVFDLSAEINMFRIDKHYLQNTFKEIKITSYLQTRNIENAEIGGRGSYVVQAVEGDVRTAVQELNIIDESTQRES